MYTLLLYIMFRSKSSSTLGSFAYDLTDAESDALFPVRVANEVVNAVPVFHGCADWDFLPVQEHPQA